MITKESEGDYTGWFYSHDIKSVHFYGAINIVKNLLIMKNKRVPGSWKF